MALRMEMIEASTHMISVTPKSPTAKPGGIRTNAAPDSLALASSSDW